MGASAVALWAIAFLSIGWESFLANAASEVVFEVENSGCTSVNDSLLSVLPTVDDVFGDTNVTMGCDTSPCCTVLSSSLPGKVFFPDSAEYQSQEESYYSTDQSDLKPSCRVSPSSADDVSVIVKIATQNKCEFAVRSGGHMFWKGSSNIGSSGFTIDMQKINSVSLSRDKKTVSFGSGCTWKMIYELLRPQHLTTVGGRSSAVGVGGFLLGAGVSFLSLQEGFGSNNVLAYEVVLADATISVVTQHSNPDLYWAIKYGSTNFGIVTRFEMVTYPLDLMWGGSLYYNISLALPLLGTLVDFTAKLAEDSKGMSAFGLIWNAAMQDYIIWSPNIYLKPVAFPPLFSELESFPPISSTMRVTDLVDITDEISNLFSGGTRSLWSTLTLKADAQILWDLHTKSAEIFEPYRQRTGFTSGVVSQPMNVGLVAAGSRNGGNPFGMSKDDGDLILVAFSAGWTDPADDDIFRQKFQEFTDWSETAARERGLLSRFIYMNYAAGNQDVMGSIGEDNLSRMREIRRAFDPDGMFEKYWKGGFKL